MTRDLIIGGTAETRSTAVRGVYADESPEE